jgi:hypothetical protein
VPAPDTLALTSGLFAYGPVPGVELIPYFLALVSWVVLALGALLLSPFTAIVRRLRRARGASPAAPGEGPQPLTPPPSPAPESIVDRPADRA